MNELGEVRARSTNGRMRSVLIIVWVIAGFSFGGIMIALDFLDDSPGYLGGVALGLMIMLMTLMVVAQGQMVRSGRFARFALAKALGTVGVAFGVIVIAIELISGSFDYFVLVLGLSAVVLSLGLLLQVRSVRRRALQSDDPSASR